MKSAETGITGVTRGPVDFARPPSNPDYQYGLAFPFQLAPRRGRPHPRDPNRARAVKQPLEMGRWAEHPPPENPSGRMIDFPSLACYNPAGEGGTSSTVDRKITDRKREDVTRNVPER